MKWDWLNELNTTAYKDVWLVWLWAATFVLFAVIAILAVTLKKDPPETFMGLWLGALTALSGVGYAQFKVKRESDHELNRIRGQARVSETTLLAGAQQINQPGAPGTVVNVTAPKSDDA